jgi:hypothetical protein
MNQSLVSKFNKSIIVTVKVHVDITDCAQWVISIKSAKGIDTPSQRSKDLTAIQDICRTPRTANCNQHVPFLTMEFNLSSEHLIKAVIIPQTCQRRTVIKRKRTNPTILTIVNGAMAADTGTATVPNKYRLITALMGSLHIIPHIFQSGLKRNTCAGSISDGRRRSNGLQLLEIVKKPSHGQALFNPVI